MPGEIGRSEMTAFEGESGRVPAYLVRPSGRGPWPGVIVIHEIFGLVDHTKDVANRFAREGYVALAPNLFGSPELAAVLTPAAVGKAMQIMSRLRRRDPALVEEALAQLPEPERASVGSTTRLLLAGLPRDRLTRDLVSAVAFLRTQDFVKGDRIGCVGFCFGGNMSIRLACAADVAACVVFYGENPSPIDDVRNLRGPVLGLYGLEDTRINGEVDQLVKAMAEHKKDFEMRLYPGAGHAFFNDANPNRYHAASARDAWERVLGFYARTLRA